MNKRSIIAEIDEMMEMYCDGCFVKRQLREDEGKKAAHRFCIESCTVGRQLQFLGGELNKATSDNR
ncbi:zinc-finger domain-containing protein [Indiicoccus explosivorum]|uniref:zinc-finger domain-containing protein n=1 Tax=Indiicoccus explosivorum TaxID=1917864 RepID=UPI000B433FFD|nr:zinc-finger domain-containing protein [Indiicoccus explosivorum]